MSEKLLAEYAVVGGGIIGLTIALEIAKRDPKATIHLYEKETDPGTHASTRNSGVLHAGFYYAPNSLKAKLAVKGHELLKKFCLDYNLPLDQCGKVVVATNADEAKQVLKLHERAAEVGVTTELVDISELSRIEPLAKSHEVALWSPMTSIGDSFAVLKQLEMLLPKNIQIRRKDEVRRIDGNRLSATSGYGTYRHVINAAGAYANVLAEQDGFCNDYLMLPFRGVYWHATKPTQRPSRLIYPVPNAKNPFLGVHLDRTVNGGLRAGPTALPVLWRESYGGFKNFDLTDILATVPGFINLATSDHHQTASFFRNEFLNLRKAHLFSEIAKIVPSVSPSEFKSKGRAGIRAQLIHKESKQLEMDFIIRGNSDVTHVLNAVSPGWTSSFAFAEHVVTDLFGRLA